MNKLSLRWGVKSIYLPDISDKYKSIVQARIAIVDKAMAEPGDFVIFTEGGPKAGNSRENWIRFEAI